MSSSNQPTRERRNHDETPRGPQQHHGSVDPQGARGVPVDTNQYHPYAQPAGRWEYVPGSPQDAQRLTARASQLVTTAEELESSARAYRAGTLD